MSFTKNESVIIAWKNNEPAQGYSLSTDGHNLYSDRLKIGYSGGTQRITKRVISYKHNKRVTRAINLANKLGVKGVSPVGE